ncbi:hypothetical protein CROQUDRAFT_659257 [Cronartium quercuum f. sp. fusiforme G11]|uniref:Pumilio homology domain family member 3 n=1 Tax=Cronartium quercuum f. sp. fusiforme G11 TaxID=708437 RepID=A0A9P6NFE4_9BASI|nr:hypothetical protein CROQUDRAFT_659257 [Cronartium quercuum f. sp. fusiforme G11]
MTTPRTPTAGPGAIGDREAARRNSWAPWTTDAEDHHAAQSNHPSHSAKVATRRASEFSAVRAAGVTGRIGNSPIGRQRLASATLGVPEVEGGVNYSALRRASQPAFVPFPQADGLVGSMAGLSLGGGAGGDPNSVLPRSTRASFNAGVAPPTLRASGLTGHRPSLPALYNSTLSTHQEAGWNPYYFRSSFSGASNPGGNTGNSIHGSPSALELSAAAAYGGPGYDYRRDSGYGPSPPIITSSESRRGSYVAPPVPTSTTGLNNLRRTQSAWHIHDAFANTPQIRHSSFSYGNQPGAAPTGLPGAGAYGMATGGPNHSGYPAGHMGYPSENPHMMSMDGVGNGMYPGAGPLLSQQQQQLLLEARRQSSLARQNVDYSIPYGMNGTGPQYPYGGMHHPAVPMSHMAPNGTSPAHHQHHRQVSNKGSFESSRVHRSAILEEFRSNKHRRWELKDMAGHLVEFAGDQLGSRHIQSKLDTASAEEKELVFNEIYPNVLQLSMDVFANYVVQKFFEQGNQSQKSQLAESLRGHVLQLSLQMYGCRVIQKALEFVLVDQQHALIKELEGEVIQCAKDQNANHVLQRSLERIDPKHNRFISQAFVGQAFALATHPYGCRVLQRVFEHMPDDQTRVLLEELHRFSNNLMTDQYGNYVAQWIITDGKKEDSAAMLSKVRGQVLMMSKHKFASNVVEKAILKSTEEEMRQMIEEILALRADGTSTVGVMLKDAFANFPLQKFLQASKEPQRSLLFEEVGNQLSHMKKYSLSYGKYLVAIEKLVSNERANAQFNANVTLSNSMSLNNPPAPVAQVAV